MTVESTEADGTGADGQEPATATEEAVERPEAADPAVPGVPEQRRSTRIAGRRTRRAAEYAMRAEALRDLLSESGGRLDPDLIRDGMNDLSVVQDRMALGVDSTVVALAGGTGSGKSSLFNAISGLQFADVGVKRPTTSLATALVWGEPRVPLLDWLDIPGDRRHRRESILDGDDEADLHGLTLVDLPDYDSVVDAHRDEVDRLLPKVDMLVWVVDPQKYADQALHAGYLRRMVGQDGSMLVLLNQVDTLAAADVDVVLADVARLLAEDGLGEVPVFPISARTGFGLARLRARLVGLVARRSKSAERAQAALARAADRLATGLGRSEKPAGRLPIDDVVTEIAAAAGVDELAASAGDRLLAPRRRRTALPKPAMQVDRVAKARHGLIQSAGEDLPGYWSDYLELAVPGAPELAPTIVDRIGPVNAMPSPPKSWTVLSVLAWCCLGLGIAALAWFAAVLFEWVDPVTFGVAVPWLSDAVDPLLPGRAIVPLLIAVLALAGALIIALARRTSRRRGAERLIDARRQEFRLAIRGAVVANMVTPIAAVLEEHRDLRERVALIRDGQIPSRRRAPAEPVPAVAVAEPEASPTEPLPPATERDESPASTSESELSEVEKTPSDAQKADSDPADASSETAEAPSPEDRPDGPADDGPADGGSADAEAAEPSSAVTSSSDAPSAGANAGTDAGVDEPTPARTDMEGTGTSPVEPIDTTADTGGPADAAEAGDVSGAEPANSDDADGDGSAAAGGESSERPPQADAEDGGQETDAPDQSSPWARPSTGKTSLPDPGK